MFIRHSHRFGAKFVCLSSERFIIIHMNEFYSFMQLNTFITSNLQLNKSLKRDASPQLKCLRKLAPTVHIEYMVHITCKTKKNDLKMCTHSVKISQMHLVQILILYHEKCIGSRLTNCFHCMHIAHRMHLFESLFMGFWLWFYRVLPFSWPKRFACTHQNVNRDGNLRHRSKHKSYRSHQIWISFGENFN